MSDQKAEQIIGESGSLDAGSAIAPSSEAKSEPVAASAPEPVSVESPDLAPKHEAGAPPEADAAKVDAPKTEAPKIEATEA